MKTIINNPNRQYWVWVTKPDYYWEGHGQDRRILDPSVRMDRSGCWWTCDRRTLRGDLVLLYRTAPMKDLAYVLQAQTNAYSDEEAQERGWAYVCDFEPLIKFDEPVSLASLREDEVLRDWCAVRMQFQRKVFPIEPDEWRRLMTLIGDENPKQQRWLRSICR